MPAAKSQPITVSPRDWGRWVPPALGLVAFAAVLLTLDAADDCWMSRSGPGVTLDEGFNVEMGVYLVESSLAFGLGMIDPATQYEIYNSPAYNPDHPPLGRLLLGLTNAALTRVSPSPDRPYVLTYARWGSAIAFGWLVWLVSRYCDRTWGRVAGLAAGLSLILMPRVFAHAHLAALETSMNLAYTATVLALLAHWTGKEKLRWTDGLWPGFLLGLALLTKMQAVFLPPVIVLWGLWNWRTNSLLPLAVLAMTSALVFFVGWPWLWGAPLERAIAYFARSTERITLYCYYFGARYADKDVPWHYPFIMFLATTPLLHLVAGGVGIAGGAIQRDSLQWRRWQLLFATFLVPLLAFSIPGTAVYDGERLFLVSWPIFAVFLGYGVHLFAQRVHATSFARQTPVDQPVELAVDQDSTELNQFTARKSLAAGWDVLLRSRWVAVGLGVVAVGSPLASMIRLHPCQLSYYSEVVGGLGGAAWLGFEPTYWGDAFDAQFLREAAAKLDEGTRVAVAPLLHPANLTFLRRDSWLRLRPDLILEPYDGQNPNVAKHVLVLRRHADPWASLSPPPEGTRVLASVERSGVVLAELLELP